MWQRLFIWPALGSVLVLCGCGRSDMGTVEGVVTMDGKPLPRAFITFQPKSGERPSVARTDERGYYELQYTTQKEGAKVGEHKVLISTFNIELRPDGTLGPVPELVPRQYNVDTTLTAQVESGSNEINFDLESTGEIYQHDTGPAAGVFTTPRRTN